MSITQRVLFLQTGNGGWGDDAVQESLTFTDDGRDLIGFFFVYNDNAGTNLTWNLSLQVRMPDGSTWVDWIANGDPTDDPALLISGLNVGSTGLNYRYVAFADPTDGSNRRMHDFIRLPPGKWRVQVTSTNGLNQDQLSLVAILREGVA